MRLFRYAIVAAVLAIPVLVAAAPASYAASTGRAAGLNRDARSAAATGGSTASAAPAVATPGEKVTFTAECSPAAGTGNATLFGTPLGLPERIPMTSVSGSDFTFTITVGLPSDISPGSYRPEIDCPGATTATADLRVIGFPSGGAATGDGTTSTTTNSGLALAGVALTGVGALAGGLALRRRGAR